MTLLAKIRTKEELDYLVEDIDKVKSKAYQISESYSIPPLFLDDYEKSVDKSLFFDNLRKEILNAGILNIVLPFYPDDTVLTNVSKWVKENLGENVVIDIKVDRTIFAGLTITYKGKYADFSLKTKFKEAIENIHVNF